MYSYNACIAIGMDEGGAEADAGADASADVAAASPPPPRDCTAMEGQGYLACCGGVRLGGVVLVAWAMLINLTHMVRGRVGVGVRVRIGVVMDRGWGWGWGWG